MIKDVINKYRILIWRINAINSYLTEEQNRRKMQNPFIFNMPRTYVNIENEDD
jgi:hypothetical protein